MGDYLFSLVLTVHVLVGLGVIGLVLVQHGKGADMGAAFGSGASGSLFGASGSANFLSRSTAGVATVFFIATVGLAYTGMSGRIGERPSGGVMSTMPTPSAPESKAADIPAAAKSADAPTPAATEPAKDAGGSKPSDIPK